VRDRYCVACSAWCELVGHVNARGELVDVVRVGAIVIEDRTDVEPPGAAEVN
jgi:hypothetical protein